MENKDSVLETLIKYLISTWGREIATEELQELDSFKLTHVLMYLDQERDKVRKINNELIRSIRKREIELLQHIIHDIWSVRIEKIIGALVSDESIDYNILLPHEKRIVQLIKPILKEFKVEEISESLIEEDLKIIEDESIKIEKGKIEYELIVSEDEVSAFIGLDGLVYRGISRGDLAMIPKTNFKLFKTIKLFSLK